MSSRTPPTSSHGSSALGFPLVGLDPDRCVDQAGGFAAGRPDALDDEQGAASRDLDRPRALALVPLGRAEGHRLPGARWKQDTVSQQVGPPEPGVPPGDVVGMHDSRSRYDVPQPSRQCGLAAGAAPVHGKHHRTATGALATVSEAIFELTSMPTNSPDEVAPVLLRGNRS
jgi:hypothetical protein